MSTYKFITITAATCPAENRSAALVDLGHFSQDCRENGAERVTYGSVISGRYPGALIFVQMFDGLDGFETIMDVIPKSAAYTRMVSTHGVVPFVRNVLRGKDIPLEPKMCKAGA